ncbi:MAG: hypothetical protein ABSF60_09790 [Verrucomicrobiota bacterium]|jgi:hypothetical protein
MLNKKVGFIALLTSVAASGVWAGTITNYAVGDVLVCFRKGGNDMVVDAGQISTLTNFVAANYRIPISQYTGTQLAQVGTNGVSWSAFTWLSDNTLFVTRPRDSVNNQTAPWPAARSSVQSGTALLMATIPPGALDQLNFNIYPVSTSTAVVEQDNSSGNANYPDGLSYSGALNGAYGGQFNGTFAGNPENTTVNNFTTSGAVVRSDFYQITPSVTPAQGKWLGYFELSTNGAMTYVAYPSTPATLISVTRSGALNTITYSTGLYGTYTLRGTNSLTSGTDMANWPALGTLTSGDTANHTTTDSTTDDVRFYVITAQ